MTALGFNTHAFIFRLTLPFVSSTPNLFPLSQKVAITAQQEGSGGSRAQPCCNKGSEGVQGQRNVTLLRVDDELPDHLRICSGEWMRSLKADSCRMAFSLVNKGQIQKFASSST